MNEYCNNSTIVWNITVLCYKNDYQMHNCTRLYFGILTRDLDQQAYRSATAGYYSVARFNCTAYFRNGSKTRYGTVLYELW